MAHVFVLGADRQPLDPCHSARARYLLNAGRAVVFRRYPFTILLKDRAATEAVTHPYRLKLDPGSRKTGMAIVNDTSGQVVFAGEITHRGQEIRRSLLVRRNLRRLRRSRKTRYRMMRYLNRTRQQGWLPPSVQSRLANNLTWVARLCRLCPVQFLSQEFVRFDTHSLQNPENTGVEYQRGTLFGYEAREYLLEKWGRRCAYCGIKGVPLEVEHIVPKARGGSNRVSNLALACRPCNEAKGIRTAAEFGFPAVQDQAALSLRDAAVINATRWELRRRLEATGLPVELGTGGRTKYNRSIQGLPKTHWLDAACVGASTPRRLRIRGIHPLMIEAVGHGRRQRCGTDEHGFPVRHAPRAKRFMGFQTGDIVVAHKPNGKQAGRHVGRISIRFRPNFKLNSFDVHPKYLRTLHQADGYDYNWKGGAAIVSGA